MGLPREEDMATNQHPRHRVTLTKGFYLAKTLVTQEQWETVMGTHPWRRTCPDRSDYRVQDNPLDPVTNVTWAETQEFISRLNATIGDSLYRLPTEAEWEYACHQGGLPSMVGNIWQWCLDMYGKYQSSDPLVDPLNQIPIFWGVDNRVTRGFATCTARTGTTSRGCMIGIRLVRETE